MFIVLLLIILIILFRIRKKSTDYLVPINHLNNIVLLGAETTTIKNENTKKLKLLDDGAPAWQAMKKCATPRESEETNCKSITFKTFTDEDYSYSTSEENIKSNINAKSDKNLYINSALSINWGDLIHKDKINLTQLKSKYPTGIIFNNAVPTNLNSSGNKEIGIYSPDDCIKSCINDTECTATFMNSYPDPSGDVLCVLDYEKDLIISCSNHFAQLWNTYIKPRSKYKLDGF